MCARECGPTAKKKFKVILKSPEMKKGGLRAAKTPRPEQSPLGGQQFNGFRTVMSNRLNPTIIWMSLHESWHRESEGG
jgi:hypothetical protein